MYYTIIISSFAFLWSHGHNCDRDRFLADISCIQRRISCSAGAY